MNNHKKFTYGGELEKTVANIQTGETHGVTQEFFKHIAESATQRGKEFHFHASDLDQQKNIGVVTKDLGEQGLDNGFNLLESALPYYYSLAELKEKMHLDIQLTQKALSHENASVLSMSNHPLALTDFKSYKKFVAPKALYAYIWYRGWDHTAGINARAQNSPTTSISVDQGADAVSVIIGAGAAFIGLFANSPYEEGKATAYKESRLTIWDRMMKFSKVHGDYTTAMFPKERFRTLAQYFSWMFGEGTGIHFVLAQEGNTNYKTIGDRILMIPGNPSVLDYLSKPSWEAYYLKEMLTQFPPQRIPDIKPHISHMETTQFAQFAGARVRYGLKHEHFPLAEFVSACKDSSKAKVEDIFRDHANFLYIEGRDPGANFVDQELLEAGNDIADSVTISPTAIQAGLIHNLEEAAHYIDSLDWNTLAELREEAVKNGLHGEAHGLKVYDFTKKILEIAAKGLSSEDQKLLAYPEWVLKNKKNGADRAIEFVEKQKTTLDKALLKLISHRNVKM